MKKDNIAEKFANVLDSGHRLIVPSCPANILIAYKPTMEFIRNMEFTIGSRFVELIQIGQFQFIP